MIERARDAGAEGIAGADAFLLHDTFGFPIDLTLELVAEHGLGVDEAGFEVLMDEQRTRAPGQRTRPGGQSSCVSAPPRSPGAPGRPSSWATSRPSARPRWPPSPPRDGRLLVKLEESPFYATGGGQVADAGWVECLSGDCTARVEDVVRLGDDQVVSLVPEHGVLEFGERVRRAGRPVRAARHGVQPHRHPPAPRRAAQPTRRARPPGRLLRRSRQAPVRLHARQRRSAPRSSPVWRTRSTAGWSRAIRCGRLTTTLDEAKRLGAMALFGEKYGDIVRMVEVGDGSFSRELCGGTHVRTTAEIGVFKILSESSSAANVRRIEAVTGPEAVALLRARDAELAAAARELRVPVERVAEAAHELRTRVRAAEKAAKAGGARPVGRPRGAVAAAETVDGVQVLITEVAPSGDGKALMALADQLRSRLGEAAVVLGAAGEGRVDLVAAVAPEAITRGVKAGEVVRGAAAAVGGGGGGRDTIARAGGRDPAGLPEALRMAPRDHRGCPPPCSLTWGGCWRSTTAARGVAAP